MSFLRHSFAQGLRYTRQPMQARRALGRLAVVLALLAGAVPRGAAAPFDMPLRDYVHTMWTHRDGEPLTGVSHVLQTSDGYLWLFTHNGLLRFDGMRFVRPPN